MKTKSIQVSLLIIALLLSSITPGGIAIAASQSLEQNTDFYATHPEPNADREDEPPFDPDYLTAIQNAASMVWDSNAINLAYQYGLDLVNVTWEDTGRYYDSSVGPNISDVTIQVGYRDPSTEEFYLTLMPVIRYPNFSDLTADVSLDDFFLLVGNERGDDLERITLREYLGNFRRYLNDPGSWAGRETSLLAPRDTHVLVSAQAAFLPIPQEGQAEFNPVIFNYQSYQGDPAVLTIVATREGTSATIIDNTRDAFPSGFSWGQRLFFNQDGERASFTGQRMSDFIAGEGSSGSGAPEAGGESGLNMVLLIQVPLKQKNPMEFYFAEEAEMDIAAAPSEGMRSDVENAVIGHGEVEGPFTEIDGIDIERDDRFPIRVTVQFYKATSTGVVSEADIQAIAEQIERVYADGDYVGSLVIGGPSERPTEYVGSKQEPENWWQVFWQRFEDNTGFTHWDAYNIWDELRLIAWRVWDWGISFFE